MSTLLSPYVVIPVAVPDPFLAAEVAYAFATNMQREGDEKHLKAVATPKHFLGPPFTVQTANLTARWVLNDLL